MLFMRFAIDVIFVNKDNCVVGVVSSIKPFRLSPIYFNSRFAIELPEGTIAASRTTLGHQVQIIK